MWKNSTRKILILKKRPPFLLWAIGILFGLTAFSAGLAFLGIAPGIAAPVRILFFIVAAALAVSVGFALRSRAT